MKFYERMTVEEINTELENIKELSHYEMARLWRFAPTGHPYFFSPGLLWPAFNKRWNEFGGMTSAISKKIGLDPPKGQSNEPSIDHARNPQ